MTRRVFTVEFPFKVDDYRASVTTDAGVVEETHDVEILDESGDWKSVAHPSMELRSAVVDAAHEYMDADAKATSKEII